MIEAIKSHAPDVVVLTEFKNNASGDKIREGFRQLGFLHQSGVHADTNTNSVLIAAQKSFDHATIETLGNNVHRCIVARLQDINVFGLLFPNKAAKKPLFDFLVSLERRYLQEPSLLVGDFNTGKPYVDQPAATILCAEYFEQLEQLGWIDVWRHHWPLAREYSWYSHIGNGFRLDHAFASPSLLPRVRRATYSHTERESGVSDHSLLVVDIE